ncbi:MAG: HAMP domain-containing protein [bacterium]|uniref:histidine kinase n=1 Tax=Candidatus Methylomirabilis tolerans TaxID=3123416 RepID=A0AAJ1EJ07_9BACT|nr:HAMP domain-containing protein [Candidatus Methylomirabilis sp.]
MRFQRKLLLGFSLMVVPVLLISAQAIWNNREERGALRALGESMARTRKYADLETILFRQSRQVWGFLTGIDHEAQTEFHRLEPEIHERLRQWKLTLTPDEMDLATDVEQLHAQMFDIGKHIIVLYQSGQRKAALALANTELKGRLLPALSAKNKEVYGAARAHSLQRAYARLEAILQTEQRLLSLVILLASVLGVTASILISRGLARPIHQLKAAMEVVGAGHLDHEVAVRSKDEIGELAQAFAGMTENLKRSHESMAWLNRELEAKIKKLEETQAQLIQSEKLASIGEMSAAVAHGLRNPLASLRAAAQVTLHHVGEEPVAQAHLKMVIAEVDRLDRRITHLLSFSRPGPLRPLPEQLPRLIDDLLPAFAGPLRDRGVRLEIDLESDLPDVYVDPIQVEQALGEILSNALDAMPNGGSVTIRGHGEPEKGKSGSVVLEIADTGDGIAAPLLPSVCDPFFTTRADGTGLGLAIAKRYVTQNGGHLDIASTPGSGTTVRITLPATASDQDRTV